MEKNMDESYINIEPWPQIFITRIIGTEELPDVEILTLPEYISPNAIPNLNHLHRLLQFQSIEEFPTIYTSVVDSGGIDACRDALRRIINDGTAREELPLNTKMTDEYAEVIFSSYPVPVMNSPITGASLMQMVKAAGTGAAFFVMFPHPDLGQISLYFLTIGVTRIVLGAADGISIGLKQGLAHVILKWMGVPETTANPKKRKNSNIKKEKENESSLEL